MFQEFNLKHYYSPCNYYPHLKCDETNFPMWSSSRNSFPDLGKNGFPGKKKLWKVFWVFYWSNYVLAFFFSPTKSVSDKENNIKKFLPLSSLQVNRARVCVYIFLFFPVTRTMKIILFFVCFFFFWCVCICFALAKK